MQHDNWYLLNTGSDTGAANMAVDEALCRFSTDAPVLRFYRWDPYCVSLGYGQKEDALDRDKCRQAGIDIVKRPTGGRAVLHANEVTYSVIIPQSHPMAQQGITELYKTLSRGLAAGLQNLGADVEIKKSTAGEQPYTSSELCFASTARYEIVAGDRKVVGSAQRRFSTAVLQHGSVLTDGFHVNLEKLLLRPIAPEQRENTVTVSELVGRPVTYGEVVEALSTGFEAALSVSFNTLDWTAELDARVNELLPKYLTDTTRGQSALAAQS
jgi:lipoyl(octanoyl) transferase